MKNKFLQTSALILGISFVGLESAQGMAPEYLQNWAPSMRDHCSDECKTKQSNDVSWKACMINCLEVLPKNN
ncbi:MAG: hypothetical protein K2X28_06655 [Alphaproteobacteria bacterium]|nr:hypothetical protein [Alphaproteobacteria bacterium]